MILYICDLYNTSNGRYLLKKKKSAIHCFGNKLRTLETLQFYHALYFCKERLFIFLCSNIIQQYQVAFLIGCCTCGTIIRFHTCAAKNDIRYIP